VTFLDNTSPLLTSIMNQKSRLSDIIEPDFGLLDCLLRVDMLTPTQYNKIRGGDKVAYERSEAMLDLLERDDQCDKFMKALQRTGQQHVINLITQHGGENDITRSCIILVLIKA